MIQCESSLQGEEGARTLVSDDVLVFAMSRMEAVKAMQLCCSELLHFCLLLRIARSERQRVFGGGLFGLGLLIVAAVMSHGYACGCTKAEALAINDNGR